MFIYISGFVDTVNALTTTRNQIRLTNNDNSLHDVNTQNKCNGQPDEHGSNDTVIFFLDFHSYLLKRTMKDIFILIDISFNKWIRHFMFSLCIQLSITTKFLFLKKE